jgi:hypothetical protein
LLVTLTLRAAAVYAAAAFAQAYAADDGLACHNLIMLLAYCYSAGIVAADCMYRWAVAAAAAAAACTQQQQQQAWPVTIALLVSSMLLSDSLLSEEGLIEACCSPAKLYSLQLTAYIAYLFIKCGSTPGLLLE